MPATRIAAIVLLGSTWLAAAPARAEGESFDAEAARRYQEILERDPGSDAVYKRLVEHYGRGPGLATLIADYERRAQGEGRSSFAVRLLLGKLYRSAGRFPEAGEELDAAGALEPSSPLPWAASAEMARRQREPGVAARRFDEALKRTKDPDSRERILRTLAEMALDARDSPAAAAHLNRLKRERPSDPFLRAEIARLYARHGALELALGEWRSILKAAGGDRRQEVDALKRIGALLVKLDRDGEAEKTYRRALSLVAAQNWNVRDLRERLVEIHRRRDDLRSLLDEFERTWRRRGFDEWLTLAKLNEEVGREATAIAAYRKAMARRKRDPAVRLALIRLFERLGRIDDVVREYKRLIAALPGQTRYHIELADLLYRRQEPTQALKMLDAVSRKHGRDPRVTEALAEAYARFGENARALKAYKRLVRQEVGDETHLVSLGEQYALMGDMEAARKTWRRILKVHDDKATAWRLLAETYAANDLPDEAVGAYRSAVEVRPGDVGLLRSLALAQERSDDRQGAVRTWERVHALTPDDRGRREARQWLVRLYGGLKRLPRMVEQWRSVFDRPATLRQRLKSTEGEERTVLQAEIKQALERGLEAGRLLAEGLARLDRGAEAEEVLRRVLADAPGDIDTLEALEDLYLSRNELDRAIDVLTKIAQVNPYRAREYYQRVAEFSLRLYKDEDAVRFAGLAVDINPDDSQAHARLARIYYRMQDLEAAAREYRKAVDLDRLNFAACFELAPVLRDLGRIDEADAQYRDVVKRATEDDMVLKAARKSLHLNLMSGGLEDLERDLLPLLWRTPARPVFRRIVTELYGHMVWPLTTQARYGKEAEAEAARRRLRRIGDRAVKPLLEALTDDDPGLRMSALAVLADLGHGDAATPLGRLLDEREARVRVRAAVALGRIGDKRGIRALRRGVEDADQGVRAASAWALGAIGGRKAASLLLALFDPRAGERKWPVRAVAAAALGRTGDPRAAAVVAGLISPEAADSKEEVRAAAAWALGQLDAAQGEAALLTSLAQDTLLVRRVAARALAGRSGRRPTAALLGALWTGEASLRRAALSALSGEGLLAPAALGAAPAFIDLGSGSIDGTRYVRDLAGGAVTNDDDRGARAARILRSDPDVVGQAVADALGSDEPEVVAQTLRDLDSRPDGPALGPLTAGEVTPETPGRLAAALVTGGAWDALQRLAAGDAPETRAPALSILGKIAATTSDPGRWGSLQGPLDAALDDPDEGVRRAAAEALGRGGGGWAEALLRKALADEAWAVRAQALRSLTGGDDPKARGLFEAALADPFASVRAAAADGLGEPGSSAEALIRALDDPAPAVRAAAAAALGRLGDPKALGPLEALRTDDEVRVREAAKASAERLRP